MAHQDALPVIYGRGHTAMPKASFYHTFVDDNFPSVFSTTDREIHMRKAKLISSAFSTRALQSFVPIIQSIVDSWVIQLDRLCNQEAPVSILEWFHFLGIWAHPCLKVIRSHICVLSGFDVISDLAFGEQLGMIVNVRPLATVIIIEL